MEWAVLIAIGLAGFMLLKGPSESPEDRKEMEEVKARPETGLHLERARFCIDCEWIHEGWGACPKCGSAAGANLRDWVRPIVTRYGLRKQVE